MCGIPLPAGLENGDRLPEPIYTPAYKAPMGEHDENISFEQTVELVGRSARPRSCATCRSRSTSAPRASRRTRGLILADTKFEFGVDDRGVMTLADEVLTSDSSRYWDAATWASGHDSRGAHGELRQADRARLARRELGQDGRCRRSCPAEIVEQTAARYRELLERLTG